jgi:hypothetical protein
MTSDLPDPTPFTRIEVLEIRLIASSDADCIVKAQEIEVLKRIGGRRRNAAAHRGNSGAIKKIPGQREVIHTHRAD